MVVPQQRKQKINQYDSHTVKQTTYKMPEEEKGVIGAINGAAKVANALSGTSPALAAWQKRAFWGSTIGAAAGVGVMTGTAIGKRELSPLLKPTSWTIVVTLGVLAFLTRGAILK